MLGRASGRKVNSMEELEPFNWVYDWDEAFLQNLDEPAYFPDADGEWSEDEH